MTNTSSWKITLKNKWRKLWWISGMRQNLLMGSGQRKLQSKDKFTRAKTDLEGNKLIHLPVQLVTQDSEGQCLVRHNSAQVWNLDRFNHKTSSLTSSKITCLKRLRVHQQERQLRNKQKKKTKSIIMNKVSRIYKLILTQKTSELLTWINKRDLTSMILRNLMTTNYPC